MLLTTLLLSASLTAPVEDQLQWHTGTFMNATGAAAKDHKNILVYFWSDQSGQCAKLYQETLTKPSIVPALENFVVYSANTADKAGYALVERFHVKTLPTMLVITPEGDVNDAILGYIGAEALVSEIERIERNEGTVSGLAAEVEKDPKNLEARQKLAIKLGDVGNKLGFEEQRTAMYELDSKFKQLPTAQMRLWELQEDAGANDEELLTADLEPMQQFLSRIKHDEVLFSGWQWVAKISEHQEKPEAARSAQVAMWEFVPEEQVARTGNWIASSFYEQREELSKKEKKFALDVALASLESVQAWSTSEGCGEGCYCPGCTEGCVGEEGEMLDSRELYVARALETVACAYAMNNKRKDAIAAIDKSLAIDPENEVFVERKKELEKRG